VNDQTDQQLLRDYAERQSEAAFGVIVQRYVDLVYSAALRLSCDAHAAKDVTQGVFVALAQNAQQLIDRPALAGWLHGTARNLAAKTVRSEVRRRAREQEVAVMNQILSAAPDSSWEHIAPHLDDALGELDDTDREAVLLRYFKNHDLRTVGATLGISDDAAQKRVSRAVERLREFFARRGVTVGASGLTVVISANAVQAAPVGLALTISTAAALTGTTLATTATVTATKAIAMTALQKTIVAATIAVFAGAGIYEARQASQLRDQVQTLQQQTPLLEHVQKLQSERDDATSRLAALRDENERLARNSGELLRLRGEVGVLRRQADELDRLHKDNLKLQQLIATNSQAPVPPASTSVTEIFLTRSKQPQRFSDEMIRSNIVVKVGSPYDSAAVDADLRNLYGTGWFRSVRVAKSESTKGITLNYVVREKPKLVKVNFSGNSQFDDESLARLAQSKAGQLLDDQLLHADAESIQTAYLNAGFNRTTVKYVSNINEDTGEGSVDFKIVE
jgi:RNA polymerase sigma factor (sigma-70 family)